MKIKTLKVTKNELGFKAGKVKLTKEQLSKVCGGHYFEDDVEFVKQTNSIKCS